jgi:membrane protease YdiL (CAAX protease family)
MPRRRRAPRLQIPPDARGAAKAYWGATQEPLYCLIFLLPFVATYEVGAIILRPFLAPERQLVAKRLIEGLLGWFGASAVWLPGAALLATLLAWHVLSRRKWHVRAWVLLLMFVESALLTLPMFVMAGLLHHPTAALAGADPEAVELRAGLVLAIGAGIYEELVFRLYLITALALLFVRVLKTPMNFAAPVIVFVAALLFAAAHVQPIGGEVFAMKQFLIRMALGAYLAIVFVGRGLGVVTGCHTAYDLIVLVWIR